MNRDALAALLLAPLLLAGCEVGPDPTEVARIRAGTEAVRATLKQPETAQFKSVAAYGETVCGEVNASVGMGQTGYERFILKDGKVTLASQLSTDTERDQRWATDCRR
jgi:hypothetical protein